MVARYRRRQIIPSSATSRPGDLRRGCSAIHTLPERSSKIRVLVRHRWPSARILVVRDDVQFLEDALYDHRVMPGINPEALLS